MVTLPNSDDRSVPQLPALRSKASASSSVLQIFRSIVDDPYLAALARRARRIIIDLPDRPSPIVAPNQNLPTNNSAKMKCDVDQQPQRHQRSAGPPLNSGNRHASRTHVRATNMSNAAKFR